MAHFPFFTLCRMSCSCSSPALSSGILSTQSSNEKFGRGGGGRRKIASGQGTAQRSVIASSREGGVMQLNLCSRLSVGEIGGIGSHHDERGRRAVALMKTRGFVGHAFSSGDEVWCEESLRVSAGGGRLSRRIRKLDEKWTKITVPKAVVDDTNSESPSFLEAESESSEYQTFGDDDSGARGSDGRWTLEPSPAFSQWDSATARLADFATAAFLLLQLPQIILNTQNLLAGNYTALSAVPWMGQLTALLGNLSLLSYFASKKERGAMVVQAVGVVSTLVVLSQLAIAGAMPSAAFLSTASVVLVGLVLNFLNYNNKVSPAIWRLWGESVTVGGVTVLPQVMWSTFEPYIPHSILPGALFGTLALSMIILTRLEKLPPKAKHILGAVSAWTATLLFMWGPVAQWWQNYLYPANIKGVSVFTVLLAMLGNSLLLPRALFTRDLMWFTGSGWGTLLQGWGILISMYMVQAITDITFWGVSGVLFLWLSTMLWRDSKAFDLNSPFSPLVELISGKRS